MSQGLKGTEKGRKEVQGMRRGEIVVVGNGGNGEVLLQKGEEVTEGTETEEIVTGIEERGQSSSGKK